MDHSSGLATHLRWISVQVQPGMPGPASYIPAPSNEATGSCRFIKHQWGPSWTLEPCRLATYSLHRTSMGPILNSGNPVGWQPSLHRTSMGPTLNWNPCRLATYSLHRTSMGPILNYGTHPELWNPCKLATYSLHRTSMGPILNSGTFIGHPCHPSWTLEPL